MTTKPLELYLAHPFDSRHKVRDWELKFENKTGINLINPFYDITRKDVRDIDLGRTERYEKLNHIELVQRDILKILQSGGMVSMIDGNLSYGTIQEMVYGYINHKNVYSIVSNGHENHPWIRYHSTKIFKSLDNFEKWISIPCKYDCGGNMNVIGINEDKSFDMYLCNNCDKSWMEDNNALHK